MQKHYKVIRSVLYAILAYTSAQAQTSVGIFRPQTGDFFLDTNHSFAYDTGDSRFSPFGTTVGIPVAGDWTGDGKTKIGLYVNGFWLLDMNGNGVWDGTSIDRLVALGGPGQTPIVGDWNGDGRTKVGSYGGGFFALDYNGNGVWDGPSYGDEFIAFGGNPGGEQPVVGDWNGDGRSKIGYFYAQTGVWALDTNGNGVFDNGDLFSYFTWGLSSKGVVGLWGRLNATDKSSKIGVYSNGFWLIDFNGNGQWDGLTVDRFAALGGLASEVPVIGDWNGSHVDKIGVLSSGTSWALDFNGSFGWDNGDVLATFSDQADTLGLPIVGNWTSPAIAPIMLSVVPSTGVADATQTPVTFNAYASGGSPPYSYSWSSPVSSSQSSISLIPGSAGMLTAGLTVTDSIGRSSFNSSTIAVYPALGASLSLTDSSAFSPSVITVNLVGGLSPFSFQWSGDAGGISRTSQLLLPQANSYSATVIITDAVGTQRSYVSSGSVP